MIDLSRRRIPARRQITVVHKIIIYIDAYENTWKCGKLKLHFSPSAGGSVTAETLAPVQQHSSMYQKGWVEVGLRLG